MRWKPLFAVLLGLLMIGVTAGSVNAQTFKSLTSKISSANETTFVNSSLPSISIPNPTKVVSSQDITYYKDWVRAHTYKARVYERRIPLKNKVYIVRTIIIPCLDIKLTMTSAENVPQSILLIDNMHSHLIMGRTTSYETTVIVTRENDPFKWWTVSPYLPRWTWKRSGNYYVAVDPINLVWGAPKGMVKDTLSEHSWHDYTGYGSEQYIYIPGRGWVEADDMFKGFALGTQRHVRLWQLPNGITVGSVHLEHWSWSKFDHVVDSYEKPEIEMLSTFNSWNKEYDYYNLNNPKKDGDGKATYIWRT